MSLFATDTAALTAAAEPWAASEPSLPADVLAELLPSVVHDALGRGHVRAAAMAFEQAMAMLPLDHPAMQQARYAIDQCSAQDAARQQRLLAGELVVVPSLTETTPGVPRFYVGVTADELGDAVIQWFVSEECNNGHQAELRNFLDEALLATDGYLDLDPTAGVGVLSAATLTTGSITALQPDVVLQRFIARNANAITALIDDAPTVRFATSIDDACNTVRGGRHVVHLGTTPTSVIEAYLPTWGETPVAIAWDATDRGASAATQQALDAAGFQAFMLAEGDAGVELRPWRDDCGATMAFSLSDAFIETLGGA
jgi:hypothetical protein